MVLKTDQFSNAFLVLRVLVRFVVTSYFLVDSATYRRARFAQAAKTLNYSNTKITKKNS